MTTQENTVVDVKAQPDTTEEPQAPKGIFAKCCVRPPAPEKPKTDELVDAREPKLTIIDQFYVVRAVGLNWILIILGTLFNGALGVIPLLFYMVLGDLVDRLVQAGTEIQSLVNQLGLYLLFIAIGGGLCAAMSYLTLDIAYERIGVTLKHRYFSALVKQEMGFFDIKKSGALSSVISDDVKNIQEGYAKKIAQVIQFSAQAIVGIVLAFRSSWKMSLIMIASGPVLLVMLAIAGILMKVFTEKASVANGNAFSTATEVLSSMRTVRSMGGEDREDRRFLTDLRKVNLYGIGKGCANAFGFGVINFVIWADCALAFWFGGLLVSWKEISVGAMMQVFGMMLFAVMGVGQALAQLPEFAKSIASSNVLLKVIKREPSIRYSGGEKIDKINGDIAFENVTFTYPSRPNTKPVVKDFSFKMEAGKKYALVGASGSGKSTMVGLLEKFYEPDSGSISIDGKSLKTLDPQWLHRHIAIVTQEPVLFNTSIKNNILYALGDEKVTQEEIEAAAKVAFAHDFIMELPNGYDTIVGERGTSLSGGQKQRVAIARAVLQNPKILLLDEATSALDTESEKFVQQALDKLMQGRTSIVIAHRLSTIQDADVIIAMSQGEIKEVGKHHELLANAKGLYRKLAKKQMLVPQTEHSKSPTGDSTPLIATQPNDVMVSIPSEQQHITSANHTDNTAQ